MKREEVEQLAGQLLQRQIGVSEFLDHIQSAALSIELDDATLDLDRRRRCGFSEVVYGEGKSIETLAGIFQAMIDQGEDVLATRVASEKASALASQFPTATFNEQARTFRIPNPTSTPSPRGQVAVVTAGTSDRPVAEEARETLDWMRVHVSVIQDVGVAGPHRLTPHLSSLRKADAIVVVAGMEGALPSVVGGHVACPVIAVPTSTGYGAHLGGIAPLLGMLNSCAANVAVVNIDAGFKGAYLAGLIARRPHDSK